MDIKISGSTAGNSTNGVAVFAQYHIIKTGTASNWLQSTLFSWYADNTRLVVPTLTTNTTSDTITVNQVAAANNDGIVSWNVEVIWCALNTGSASAPTLS
jgi:hypothetical protein